MTESVVLSLLLFGLSWWQHLIRWTFLAGFYFLIGAVVWFIFKFAKLEREWTSRVDRITLLELRIGLKQAVETRHGLKDAIDQIQAAAPVPKEPQ